jgi:hypothetical protein
VVVAFIRRGGRSETGRSGELASATELMDHASSRRIYLCSAVSMWHEGDCQSWQLECRDLSEDHCIYCRIAAIMLDESVFVMPAGWSSIFG